jgi:hypothetical protein
MFCIIEEVEEAVTETLLYTSFLRWMADPGEGVDVLPTMYPPHY